MIGLYQLTKNFEINLSGVTDQSLCDLSRHRCRVIRQHVTHAFRRCSAQLAQSPNRFGATSGRGMAQAAAYHLNVGAIASFAEAG
jgi:hypothetical protein